MFETLRIHCTTFPASGILDPFKFYVIVGKRTRLQESSFSNLAKVDILGIAFIDRRYKETSEYSVLSARSVLKRRIINENGYRRQLCS